MTGDGPWAHLEDDPPDDVRAFFEAARRVPPRRPEEAADMRRSFLVALAAQRRARARKRVVTVTMAVGLVVMVLVIVCALTFHGGLIAPPLAPRHPLVAPGSGERSAPSHQNDPPWSAPSSLVKRSSGLRAGTGSLQS